jgi:hypothetical protein
LFVGALIPSLKTGDQAVILENRFLFGGQGRVKIQGIISGHSTLDYRTPPPLSMFPGFASNPKPWIIVASTIVDGALPDGNGKDIFRRN